MRLRLLAMTTRRRGLRNRSVPVAGWLPDLTGGLLVLTIMGALLARLWDLLQSMFR